jgi:mRNA interferase RelE/StbE
VARLELSRAAQKDIRRLEGSDRRRVLGAPQELEREAENLDVKALAGHPGWFRMRVGDFRAVYAPVDDWLYVAHVVNRRDLTRTVDALGAPPAPEARRRVERTTPRRRRRPDRGRER